MPIQGMITGNTSITATRMQHCAIKPQLVMIICLSQQYSSLTSNIYQCASIFPVCYAYVKEITGNKPHSLRLVYLQCLSTSWLGIAKFL